MRAVRHGLHRRHGHRMLRADHSRWDPPRPAPPHGPLAAVRRGFRPDRGSWDHHLRYGVPFHIIARDPSEFDWTWTDIALAALRERGIEPIADLLHFAVPDPFHGIGDPAMPAASLAYATAFADR